MTTSRLVRDPASLIRSWQISNAKIFVVVEGKSDLYFYDKLSRNFFGNNNIYKIISAHELPNGSSGGKDRILRFHKFLSEKNLLISDFCGKKTAFMAVLDKDIDEIIRKKRYCHHIAYTKQYNFECYVFENCNLHEAIAISASRPISDVAAICDNQFDWIKGCISSWEKWIYLCIAFQLFKIRGEPNFSCWSRINIDEIGTVDEAKYLEYVEKIKASSGVDIHVFNKILIKIESRVSQSQSNENYCAFFNGKWYRRFLRLQYEKLLQKPKIGDQYLDTFWTAALSTVNWGGAWNRFFTEPLTQIAKKVH